MDTCSSSDAAVACSEIRDNVNLCGMIKASVSTGAARSERRTASCAMVLGQPALEDAICARKKGKDREIFPEDEGLRYLQPSISILLLFRHHTRTAIPPPSLVGFSISHHSLLPSPSILYFTIDTMSSLLLVVSGASRGLGQAIATAFCEHATGLSRMRALLVARSEEGLAETQQRMKTAAAANNISLEDSIHIMDLANLDTLDENIDALLEQTATVNDYDRVVLVNNAGSLGHLGPLADMISLKDLQQSLDFNVTSSLWLSIRFVKSMLNASCVVVNISSLCAIEPFPTMGVYCTGKAARDMFYKVWAKELGDASNVKLLNYAPGALATDMTGMLRHATQLDPSLQTFYRDAHESGELIPPSKTALRMVKLVWNNEFENGSHIDYWDLSDEK